MEIQIVAAVPYGSYKYHVYTSSKDDPQYGLQSQNIRIIKRNIIVYCDFLSFGSTSKIGFNLETLKTSSNRSV